MAYDWFRRTLLAGTAAIAVVMGGMTAAKANFIVDPIPGGSKLFLVAEKGSPDFSGHVGSQTGPDVINAVADVAVDVANGFATIKPDKSLTLTDIVFSPVDPTLFGDFSFRGQLLASGTVTVIVKDNQGDPSQTFTFNVAHANADFTRFGIISTDKETIQSVEILDASGFKEVKQIEFSYCAKTDGTCNAGDIPEPASLLLLGTALLGLKAVRRWRS